MAENLMTRFEAQPFYIGGVSTAGIPARDFWPLESRHRHFPNPNPNLIYRTLCKKL